MTCSVDWTVKLWRARSLGASAAAAAAAVAQGGKVGTSGAGSASSSTAIVPLYSFDEADDYVYDVKWHPAHPAVFGMVDGSGKFDVWNLNADTEVPTVQTTIGSGRALNKMQWDRKDGRRAAIGGSDGRLYVYDIGDMAIPRETEWADLQKTIAGMVGGGGSGAGGNYHHGQVNGTTQSPPAMLSSSSLLDLASQAPVLAGR